MFKFDDVWIDCDGYVVLCYENTSGDFIECKTPFKEEITKDDLKFNLSLSYNEVCGILTALNIMEYHHGLTKEERELFNKIELVIKNSK